MRPIRRTVCAVMLLLSSTAYAQLPPATQPAPLATRASADARAGVYAGTPRCPVSGAPIQRRYVLRYRDRAVYCSSADALSTLRKDPAAYSAQIQAQWDALRPLRVQVRCPVSRRPVEPRFFADSPAGEVFFASAEDRDAWLKDPPAYTQRLAECYTFQTRCVMCSEPIDPTISAEIDGRVVYFGCRGCVDPFRAEQIANLRKLDEQTQANRQAWEAAALP